MRCLWNDNLFKIDDQLSPLSTMMKDIQHPFVAKGLFLRKRAHPNIMPAVAFLSTQVEYPTKHDWFNLCQMIDSLKTTFHDGLTLKANLNIITNWCIDAVFVVHSNCRSHTGACVILGEGEVTSLSTKQKNNS